MFSIRASSTQLQLADFFGKGLNAIFVHFVSFSILGIWGIGTDQ
jgi:hypothetical protein